MVEAMACGVPTVASSSSCIPEVSGGVLGSTSTLFQSDQMAEIIQRGWKYRPEGRLQQKGVARTAEFSWEFVARQTLRVFAGTITERG